MDENARYILVLLFEKEHGTGSMVGLKKIQDARDWVLDMAGIQYEMDAKSDEATKDD